jgi:hypothetical protein
MHVFTGNLKMTNSQTAFRQSGHLHSASEEIASSLQKSKVHHQTHKRQSPVRI